VTRLEAKALLATFTWAPVRFLRMTLTASGDSWWSVAGVWAYVAEAR
jgi:hypothetical protein